MFITKSMIYISIPIIRSKHTERIASTGGLAKQSPHMAAVSIPSPTNPAWAGSWPLPPPVTWNAEVPLS